METEKKWFHLLMKTRNNFYILIRIRLFLCLESQKTRLYLLEARQSIFIMSKTPLCEETEDNADNSKTVMLQIRFDALNRSKELFVYNYNDLEI